jgi:hypothetical protein
LVGSAEPGQRAKITLRNSARIIEKTWPGGQLTADDAAARTIERGCAQ